MRNRKSVIVAFMIVACMLMAIGFAAFADILDVTGIMEIGFDNAQSSFDGDVYFSAASNDGQGGTIYTASVNSNDPDKASFTVDGLKNVGETCTITYTIQNENEFDVNVTLRGDATHSLDTSHLEEGESAHAHFDVTVQYFGDLKASTGTLTVPAKSSATFTITVELIKTPQLADTTAKIHETYFFELDVVDVQ